MRPFVRAFQLALMFRQGFQDDGISLHGGIFVEFAGESEFLLAMLKMCVYDGVGGGEFVWMVDGGFACVFCEGIVEVEFFWLLGGTSGGANIAAHSG